MRIFRSEWKQSNEFIIPPTPIAKEHDKGLTSVGQNTEDPLPIEEVLIAPTDQTNKARD